MSKYRELIKGDRLRITGPWFNGGGGREHIGKTATYIGVNRPNESYVKMPVNLKIDGLAGLYSWCRENVRALPRRKKGVR